MACLSSGSERQRTGDAVIAGIAERIACTGALLLGLVAGASSASPHGAEGTAQLPAVFTREALCTLIEEAADDAGLPVSFFTRLIWQESSLRIDAVSPKGAQGIAQFMPGTAAERGLADPFDPQQAIPASAHLLSDLAGSFGNLGLAAAAYNAGARRVSDWLAGRDGLPGETRRYVSAITGFAAEDWQRAEEAAGLDEAGADCLETVAMLGRLGPQRRERAVFSWGAQSERLARYSATALAGTVAERVVRRAGTVPRGSVVPQRHAPLKGIRPVSGGSLCAAVQRAGGACGSSRR